MIRLVIIGAPGKGTHTYKIAQKYNLKHIVVGDAVKDEIRKKTKLGQIMYDYTSVGKFVPSDIVIDVLNKQVKDLKGFDGFIIDTAPINLDQKRAMKDWTIDGVVWLKITNFDILTNRILDRLICPNCKMVTCKTKNKDGVCKHCGAKLEQRYDDNEEVLKKRIEQYKSQTLPVIDEYQKEGKVMEVNAEQHWTKVFADICKKIDNFLAKKSLN